MGGCKLPLVLILSLLSIEGAIATATPYLDQGFQFDYEQPGQSLTVPVTSQCERVRLKWGRDKNNTGEFPVAPYFLQVYTSTSSIPYFVEAGFGPTFDWDVPFIPNTQYQICMFDIKGVSGGCQQTYTIITNSTANNPTCGNVTAPPALSVTATVPTGAMPQYGYIDQCKSLSVKPNSGSPPFRLTVAPSGHPPYNITSNSMDPISWTVSLPLGFRFFLSLESADGQKWSNGPMRVGGLGPTACLAPGTILKSASDKVIIGSTVGGTFLGMALGVISYLLFLRFRPRRKAPSQTYFDHPYLARDESSRPLKSTTPAPSTIAFSSFGANQLSHSTSSPSLGPIQLITTPSSRATDLPPLTPPLEPLRPSRSAGRRHRSVTPYTVPPSEADSAQTQYPADIKRPLPPSDVSLFSREDTETLASSSSGTGTGSRSRPISTVSRAPTYVPRTPPPPRAAHRRTASRGLLAEHTINETEDQELPPLYGNHTADPSLNYAPSILSSGNRF